MDFQFGSKHKVKHVKIYHTGRKPDREWSARRGGIVMGWSSHVGDRAAYPGARSGPTLLDMVLGPLVPELHDFHD